MYGVKHFSSSMRVEIKNFRVKEMSTAIAVLVRPTSFSQLNDFAQGYITTVWSDYKVLIFSWSTFLLQQMALGWMIL